MVDRFSRGLTALFLAACGSLIALLLILASQGGAGSAERLRLDLTAAAASLADRLDQGIYERSRDVQLAAQNPVLADPAASVEAKREVLARWHELRPEYAIAVLASPEGRILATSNRLVEGADVSAREWFLKGRAGPAVVDVHDAVLLGKLLRTDALNPPRFLDLVAPVRGRDGTLRGVVAVHLYADWIGEVERSTRVSPGAQPRLTVVSGTGDVLFGSGAPGLGAMAAPRADAEPQVSVGVTTSGHQEYPGLGWRVIAEGRGGAERLGGPLQGAVLALPVAVMAWTAAHLFARRRSAGPGRSEADAAMGEATAHLPALRPAPAPVEVGDPAPAACPEPAAAVPAPSSPAPSHAAPEAAGHHRQKVEALRQLTDGIAHDFSNLLTIVLGNLGLLAKRDELGEDGRRLLEAALRGAERGAALTERMLAFSHRQPPKPARTDLAELVQGMCNLIGRSGLPGVQVRLDFPEELDAAVVDAKQLEVAILNLVTNAQDAMQGGGVLTLTASEEVVRDDPLGLRPGRYLCLAVLDDGEGMDEATLAQATTPFFSTKGGGRRTGLGLSVVQDIMARSGGALRLESRLGQGTRAELWLPAAAGSAPFGRSARPAASTRRGLHAVGPLSILLVDDDALVRECLAEMLADLGHRVTEAGSGPQALEILGGASDIDLLITDYAMPGMTGIDLAEAVVARHPRMKVVLASGYAQGSDGVGDRFPVLLKPIRRAAVETMLANLVERGASGADAPKVLPFRRVPSPVA